MVTIAMLAGKLTTSHNGCKTVRDKKALLAEGFNFGKEEIDVLSGFDGVSELREQPFCDAEW